MARCAIVARPYFSYAKACDFREKQLKRNKIDCESLLRGLVSGYGSVMITGLLVNTGAKYGASIYGLYIYSY